MLDFKPKEITKRCDAVNVPSLALCLLCSAPCSGLVQTPRPDVCSIQKVTSTASSAAKEQGMEQMPSDYSNIIGERTRN